MEEDGDFAKLLEDEIMNSDTTECSTSFDDSDSGDTLSDSEVLSDFCGGKGSAMDFDGYAKKRKKLSSHWRSFIHPLMWRCKWVELQINKLNEQAQKYDRKLQAYSQQNPVQFENSTLEGPSINTFSQKSELLRRRRRRRTEETNDVAAYMSQHNLFSYYERRKYIREISHNMLKNPDAPQGVNPHVELGNEEPLCVEAEDCDKFVEEKLRTIEMLRSRVLELKARTDKVKKEHAVRPSSTDTMSTSPSTRSPPSTAYLIPFGTYIASQLMSDYNLGAALLPQTGVPDADRSRHPANLAYASENENEEDILIDNHIVRDELRYLKEIKIRSIQRPLVVRDDRVQSVAQPAETADDQPRPQASNLTNAATNSRKRRRRN